MIGINSSAICGSPFCNRHVAIAVLGEPIKATPRPQRLRFYGGRLVPRPAFARRPAMEQNEAVNLSCALKVGHTPLRLRKGVGIQAVSEEMANRHAQVR